MVATIRRAYGGGMIKRILRPADYTGLVVCAALSATLTGCIVDGASQHPRYQERPPVQTHVAVVFQDDYDYYPGYEVYYSRSRREYVYLDGGSWVRRSEPRGVSLSVLLAAPSVRMDFRDSPEQHHGTVVRSYPKNWQQADKQHDEKSDEKADRKKGKKGDKKHGRDNDDKQD